MVTKHWLYHWNVILPDLNSEGINKQTKLNSNELILNRAMKHWYQVETGFQFLFIKIIQKLNERFLFLFIV